MQRLPDDGRGLAPRARVELARDELGQGVLLSWSAGLLGGSVRYDDPTRPHLTWLGGPHAAWLLKLSPVQAEPQDYWARAWGGRALLYVWDDAAPELVPAVLAALVDPSWRVREMAAKVAARREVGQAGEALLPLADDEVPRVRAAAVRALGVVGEGEALDVARAAQDDADPAVHRAGELSLRRLQERLDRW
ncbi:HEAT repeat domain-containing protein [Angustibacter sp. McL0619]|uniref:HEAT repeat domain-containing protein n=1 Tax=Angustibacter sp. McL0619 TaxID=3415676 RepID=UPI003CEF0C9E